MESRRVLAPAFRKVSKIYEAWKRSHLGTKEDFYKFLTTPGLEREEFLATLRKSQTLIGTMVMNTYMVKL